jgi:hypothetical protein
MFAYTVCLSMEITPILLVDKEDLNISDISIDEVS